MFDPKYTISPELLNNITRIHKLITSLNNQHFSHPVLMELLSSARSLSTHASTSIEGNLLPLIEVKQILQNQPSRLRDSEKEVVNYNQTLVWLDEQIDSLSPEIDLKLILKVHEGVTRGLLPSFQSGHIRQFPVVVNNPRTREPAYLAPDYEEVPKLISSLMEFIDKYKNTLDPLILAGLFHKQFILIHPFMDGNGRTTRLLTKVLLAKLGLNTFKLFSFENYYNQNITKYFATVGEQGDYYELSSHLDFTKWLIYFTDGIIDELVRVGEILSASTKNSQDLRPHHRKILDYLKNHSTISDKEYKKIVKRGDSTRARDFSYLMNLGLLIRHNAGPSTYYTLK